MDFKILSIFGHKRWTMLGCLAYIKRWENSLGKFKQTTIKINELSVYIAVSRTVVILA